MMVWFITTLPTVVKTNLLINLFWGSNLSLLKLQIFSDNETFIEIRGIGKVGKVEEKIIQLPPGKYYFIGKKKGFRDIFLDIDLTGNEPVQLKIICLEKI